MDALSEFGCIRVWLETDIHDVAFFAEDQKPGYASRRALNFIRTYQLPRLIFVLTALCGWLVLSDHCALGSAARQAQINKGHACCHNGTAQDERKPTPGDQGVQCCKSLHVVVPGDAKLPLVLAIEIIAPPLAWPAFGPIVADRFAATPAIGPPPDGLTFVELVLHRSLRSHAPPLLA